MHAPAAVLIAAPASGQGKTTVASALARLHARAGARVRAFKCGPDFLDPQWLALASGAPVDSLDLWINGEADCAARLAAAAREADLVIVEGVMGLFDGQPSAADLARCFNIPVLAVIDAGAMAGTFGAVAHGLRTWRPGLPWAGVLANRVGSARHAAMLQEALDPEAGWLGHLGRDPGLSLPSRHLGLAQAAELPDALARLDRAADALAATPLGQRALPDWPRWAAPQADSDSPSRPKFPVRPELVEGQALTRGPGGGFDRLSPNGTFSVRSAHQYETAQYETAAPVAPLLAGRRIAVARDAAFAFLYPANLALLRALGAEVVFFSPLGGEALPACDALWLPGGYPELHAAALAARVDLRAQVEAHVAAGRPLWAECGGMMALAETLIDAQGQAHAMWGLLPGTAVLGKRLAALGPHRLTLGGTELRGHSFHWSRFETPLAPAFSTEPARGAAAGAGEPVYVRGSLRASWFHPWFASSPALAARLFSPEPLA